MVQQRRLDSWLVLHCYRTKWWGKWGSGIFNRNHNDSQLLTKQTTTAKVARSGAKRGWAMRHLQIKVIFNWNELVSNSSPVTWSDERLLWSRKCHQICNVTKLLIVPNYLIFLICLSILFSSCIPFLISFGIFAIEIARRDETWTGKGNFWNKSSLIAYISLDEHRRSLFILRESIIKAAVEEKLVSWRSYCGINLFVLLDAILWHKIAIFHNREFWRNSAWINLNSDSVCSLFIQKKEPSIQMLRVESIDCI